MKEKEFVSKYLHKVKEIAKQFKNEELKDKREKERLSGYNNAIVSILKCINPMYEYDLDDEPFDFLHNKGNE
ncbi:hypothetical protein [Gracilibacillus saliphilus]|uniref:hypothetical protein n=1 Tax=Gracilibacillus saliphilus TaxID=543890 RepID=UPI001EE30744|nr:hypothetical protein [Gracilibacillus saliphilus]